jgi:hypothetical protein
MAFTLNPSATLPYGEGTQFIPNSSNGIVNFNTGSIVMDATSPVAVEVPCGFVPRKIRVIDITALAMWEKLDMLPAADTLKTTYASGAPTTTLDTTGIITINDGVATQGANKSFTISAAALTASHTYVFEAWA